MRPTSRTQPAHVEPTTFERHRYLKIKLLVHMIPVQTLPISALLPYPTGAARARKRSTSTVANLSHDTLIGRRRPTSGQYHVVQDLVVLRPLVSPDRFAELRDVVYPESAVEADLAIPRIRAVARCTVSATRARSRDTLRLTPLHRSKARRPSRADSSP